MEDKYFEKSDGWLFATLKHFSRWEKITLYKIISIGDMINHAIFTLSQINDGLSRLESAKYIVFENCKIKFTIKAKNFIQSHHKRFETSIDEQVRYANIFHSIIIENQTLYKEYFSIQEYDTAVNEYCK